jgi:type IV secretory pathway VirJ component
MTGAALALTLGLLARAGTAAHPARPAAGDSLADLPLVLEQAPPGPLLAVLLTGDGGWSAGDRSLAAAFVHRDVAVVGFNSPQYLAHARTPDEAGEALARILDHFLSSWHRERAIVVGYSRGADIGPFMISRLPSQLRDRVALVTLLGPGEFAGFKDGMLDVMHSHASKGLPVSPAVAGLRGTPVLCIYGSRDPGAICPSLQQAGLARAIPRTGGHVIHGSEGPGLVDTILGSLDRKPWTL